MGAPLAVTAWKALYDAIGDFAIVVAINPITKAAYLYVLASDMPKLAAQISKDVAAAGSSVQAAMAAANGSKPYLDAVANAALQLQGAMAGSTEGGLCPHGKSRTNAVLAAARGCVERGWCDSATQSEKL